jgi:glycosyltransferase involved in cell wall biosynthesis
MRVLHLAQFYAPIVGGEERMTESLATALVACGHDVAVATLRQPGQSAYEERDGVRVHRLGGLAQRVGRLFSDDGRRHAPPIPDPETVIALRRVLARERPEIVHGHNWLALAYLPLRRRHPAAYLLSLHDYSLVCANKLLVRMGEPCSGPGPRKCVTCAMNQYGSAIGPAIAALTYASGRVQRHAVDLLLPISRAVAESCGLDRAGVPYEVMPNFYTDAAPGQASAEPLLERLPEGDFILFVGDVTAAKGVGTLVAAHRRLSGPMPLVIIGRLVEPELIPPSGDVTALGILPHAAVLAAWRRCAIGVVPSVQPEAFGVVAIEAMAAGAPLIASRTGGLADVVLDGESGMLVSPGDVGELAAALERLAGDPQERRRLRDGALRRAQDFTATAVVPRFEAAYQRALAARRDALAA